MTFIPKMQPDGELIIDYSRKPKRFVPIEFPKEIMKLKTVCGEGWCGTVLEPVSREKYLEAKRNWMIPYHADRSGFTVSPELNATLHDTINLLSQDQNQDL